MSTIVVNQTFSGSANPVGGIFSTAFGNSDVKVVGGLAEATALSTSCLCYDNSNTYTNNQSAQITIGGTPANGAAYAVILRITNPTNSSLLFAQWVITQGGTTGGWFQIVPNTGHLMTPILNSPVQAGDRFLLSVTNQTYSFFQNGFLLATYTDPSAFCVGGTTGMAFFSGTALTDGQVTNFTASDGDSIPYVPGVLKPDLLENVRYLTARGKKESGFLVVLLGTAAVAIPVDIKTEGRDELLERISYVTTSFKTAPFLILVNSYPSDIISGFDNFTGSYFPPEPFDPTWKPPFNAIDRSYVPYVPSTDAIAKGFRRVPYFQELESYIKQQPSLVITDLVKIPLPPSDNTFRARMSGIIYDLPFTEPTWKSSWFISLMPGLLIPRVPVPLFAGAAPIRGFFSGYTVKGYFN